VHNGPYAVQWYKNGIAIAGATNDTLPLNITANGNFFARLSNDSTCIISDTTSIIYEAPLSIAIDTFNLGCNIYLLKIDAQENEIQWRIDGNYISNASNDSLYITENIEGVYDVVFINSSCFISNEVYISEKTLPEISIDEGNYLLVDLNEFVELNVSTNIENYSLNWLMHTALSCLDCVNPSFIALENSIYEVIITDNTTNCTNRAKIEIELNFSEPKCEVYIPNIFTPNNNNLNDNLKIFIRNCENEIVNIQIFNRFGEVVYQNKSSNIAQETLNWNGLYKNKVVNGNVFYYVVSIDKRNESYIYAKGNITIVK